MTPQYSYEGIILRVVDGDTVDLMVDLGFRIAHRIRVRLFGIDAPERGEDGWADSRRELHAMLPETTPVIVKTFKDPKDKYGRWLAQIFVDGVLVNQKMVDSGHARAS